MRDCRTASPFCIFRFICLLCVVCRFRVFLVVCSRKASPAGEGKEGGKVRGLVADKWGRYQLQESKGCQIMTVWKRERERESEDQARSLCKVYGADG